MDREIQWQETAPEGYDALKELGDYVTESDLEPRLVEIAKLRASQMNRCAYCVDVHAERLRELEEDQRKIAAISAWREFPGFSSAERAVLAWTEAVTTFEDLSEEALEGVLEQFTEREVIDLTMAVVYINSWNRLWRAFQTPRIELD